MGEQEIGLQQSRDNATTAFNREKELDQWLGQNQIQWRVQDLKKAGLNPMLAAGGGLGMGMATQMAPQAQSFSTGGAVQTGVQAAQTGSQIAANTAMAQSSVANAHRQDVAAAMDLGINTDVGKQTIAESQARTVLIGLQGAATQAQTSLTAAQVSQAEAQTSKIAAEISNLGKSGSLIDAQTAMQRLSNVMQGMSNAQFRLMAPELFVQAHAASQSAAFNLDILEKAAAVARSDFGTGAAYVDRIMNWFHLGANISSSTVSKQ